MNEYILRELQIDTEDRADVENEYQETGEGEKIRGSPPVIDQQRHRAEDKVYEEVPVIAHLCKSEKESAEEELRTEDEVHFRDEIL